MEAAEAEAEFNLNLPKTRCNAAVAASPSVAAGSSAAALYAAAASAAVAGPASSEWIVEMRIHRRCWSFVVLFSEANDCGYNEKVAGHADGAADEEEFNGSKHICGLQ